LGDPDGRRDVRAGHARKQAGRRGVGGALLYDIGGSRAG
jgi:hypothetical protein